MNYPLGAHSWHVVGKYGCSGKKSSGIPLHLSTCNETEFNCMDGQCVDMNQRCNGKVECNDKTGTFFHSHL